MKKTMMILLLAGAVLSLRADHGAGELLKPGRTWYVAVDGSDKNDGKTPGTAWKSIEHGLKFLKAGDTLQIGEGIHKTGPEKIMLPGKKRFVPDTATLRTDGVPGSPIRIRGAENGKTVLTGAVYLPAAERRADPQLAEFELADPPLYDTVWEYPSDLMLQRVPALFLVKEYPGTYYLAPDNTMTVHFAAAGQKGVHVSHDRIGLSLQACYVIVENLTFTYYREALFAQQNMAVTRRVNHVTIRNCTFANTYKAGVILHFMDKALVTGNRCIGNGDYGSIRVSQSSGNLITGNWAGRSPQTRRDLRPYAHNYAMQKYGGKEDRENHFIGNVMDDVYAFRWKPLADPGSRFEENILTGILYAESKPTEIFVRGNLLAGEVQWMSIGRNLQEKDFAGSPVVFKENARRKEDFKIDSEPLRRALKLKMEREAPVFPKVVFEDPVVTYADDTAAVVAFRTPDNDGWGRCRLREKGQGRTVQFKSPRQGSRHGLGLTGLKPATVYQYKLVFSGRRGESAQSPWMEFRTAAEKAAPQTIAVDPRKMSLFEAGLRARPGDTVVLLPGTHYGQFIPARSGEPGRPVTLRAEPGAVIDGMGFYTPLVDLSNLKHWIIDGLSFVNLAPLGKMGLIRAENASDITVRNCRGAEHPYTGGPFFTGSGEGFLIENNLSRGGSYPLMIRGKNHVIRRNTIVNATFFSIFAANVKDLAITDNIFYRPCVKEKKNPAILLENILGKVVCDGNVYFSPYKHHHPGGMIRNRNQKVILPPGTIGHWREKSGFDRTSICADPQFVDMERGDFRLKDGSPAQGKGACFK